MIKILSKIFDMLFRMCLGFVLFYYFLGRPLIDSVAGGCILSLLFFRLDEIESKIEGRK